MRFGTNITTSNPAGESPSKVLRRWVDDAVAAERLGYHSAWTTEHHFASDPGYRPFGVSAQRYSPADYDMAADPMMLLSWAAARTTSLCLGTAVSVLQWEHPVRTVERAAMLDALSGGRLMLGVGRGIGTREANVFGVPTDPQANERRYHEALSIVRQAWSGEPFSFEGEFYRLPRLAITPQPERPDPPLFIGSASHNSAIWAAQNDLPYATITWPLVAFEQYKEKRRLYLEAGQAAGHDVARHDCPHFLFMYCGESDAEASEVVEKYMTQFQYITEQHYEKYRQQPLGEAEVLQLSRVPVESHVVGSPETCRARVQGYQQEAGVNYMVFNMGYGCMPHELHSASMRRFAEQVLPHFS